MQPATRIAILLLFSFILGFLMGYFTGNVLPIM